MDSISETRRGNLIYLREHRFDGSQADFAAAIDRQPNVISRSINRESSDFRNVGNKLARHIEDKLGLHENWMDQPHSGAPADESLNQGQDGGSRSEPPAKVSYKSVEFATEAMGIHLDEEDRETMSIDLLEDIFNALYEIGLIDLEGGRTPDPHSGAVAKIIKFHR